MEGLLGYAQRELDGWAEEFEAFQARFAHLFKRSEPRQQAALYLRGLLGKAERKNCWQLAEEVGEATVDPTQRLLFHAKWDADAAQEVLQGFAVEEFGEEDGIGVLDETGFVKQGDKSVGVARQYTGTAGKVCNCQIGVFLAYVSSKGLVLLDRRLYLPEVWCQDKERREHGGVPESVVFHTKPELGEEMLQHAWQAPAPVPMRWVTGDEVYGNSPTLRASVSASGRWYVFAVSSNTPVWHERPEVEEPVRDTGGRPQTKARLAEGAPKPEEVAAIVKGWPASDWERLTVAEGEKGPRTYDWARARVVEDRGGLPGDEVWLMARRSVSDPSGLAYYLSCAPITTSLLKMAQVAGSRYAVEQCFEEAKGEAGIDQYEVRYWQSWHRHITLAMMAHTWLAALRRKAEQKRGHQYPL